MVFHTIKTGRCNLIVHTDMVSGSRNLYLYS